MKARLKLVLILLLVGCLLCVGLSTVSATDNSTNNNLVEDSDIGNFYELNDEIQNNNVLNLIKDYIATDDAFYKGITISNGMNVTINGNGYTIDANNQGRIFDIKTGATLTLNNVILTNGNAKSKNAHNGGAIYNNDGATLILNYCVFEYNYAFNRDYDSNGGVIYNKGNLEINNSHFFENHAKDKGGVIYNIGNLEIVNSIFLDNYVKYNTAYGGVLYSNKPVNCTNSRFVNNQATSGGAIYCSSQLYLNQCIFENNQLNNQYSDDGVGGGAIYCSSQLYLNQCIFENNQVDDNDGGAVCCNDLNECNNCTFINNHARYGGAISINGKKGVNLIKNCIFKENYASQYGGAISVDNSYAHISITNNQFIDNYAKDYDYNYALSSEKDCDSRNCFNSGYYDYIEYNYFPNKNQNIFIEYSKATCISIIHQDTHPYYNLNDYYNYVSVAVNMPVVKTTTSVSDIVDNDNLLTTKLPVVTTTANTVAEESNDESSDISIVLPIETATANFVTEVPNATTTSTVLKKSATGNFYELNKEIQNNNILNLTKDYNATDDAFYKGITINKGRNITINGNGHIINGNYQGRIFDIKTGATITLNNITLTHGMVGLKEESAFKKGAKNGGAIYINKGATVILNNCNFNKNRMRYAAWGKGGAIYNDGTLTVINSSFNTNAGGSGGAIYNDGTLTVINSSFNTNAGVYGGAIKSQNHFSINNTIFSNNHGRFSGGAIECDYINNCFNCTFIKNQAMYGGAICIKAKTNILHDCIFIKNKASEKGGAVYVDNKKAHLSVFHNQFINNTSKDDSINVYNKGFYKTIEFNYVPDEKDNKFMERHARKSNENHHDSHPYYNLTDYYNHGKIFNNNFNKLNYLIQNNNVVNLDTNYDLTDNIYKGIVITTNVTINGNGYTINGNYKGRIFDIKAGGTLTLNNVNLINGRAIYDGAVNGGAIYINKNATLNINNCTFNNNIATGKGNAIYNTGTLIINNSIFDNNDAKDNNAIFTHKNGLIKVNGDFYRLNDLIQNYNVINLSENYKATDNNFYKGITINKGRNIIINGNGHTIDANYQGRIFDIKTGATLTLNNVTLINGNANFKDAHNGGAIYINKGAMLKIINCTFNNNYAKHGKEIYNAGNLEIEGHFNGTIYNQGIINGGIIYYHGDSYLDADFYNNYKNMKDIVKNDYASIIKTDISKIINDSEFKNTLSIDSVPTIPLQPANEIYCNMTNPFSSSTGTPAIPDENNCFEMTIITNAGTPYYWVMDIEASYGIDLTNTYTDDKNPEGLCGGEIINHFVFHIIQDNNYFVKLNLIDVRNNEIVDTVNSNMVN